MGFSYYELKVAAAEGIDVGRWKGKTVFTCSKNELKNKGSGAFFILYDDDNLIVSNKQDKWYKYCKVLETGNVTEFDRPSLYYEIKAEVVEKWHAEEPKREEEPVVADVKLGLDVDGTLKAAREMTVASLLEGFNYGLK